ncbi:MBL fold metallo-hydrolase [Urechidicola sp. KH5]
MKFFLLVLSIAFTLASTAQSDSFNTINGHTITIAPVLHGSLVITFKNTTIFVDPYGGSDLFAKYGNPDFILITDIHGDHLNQKTLDGLDTRTSKIIAPQAVYDKIDTSYHAKFDIVNNGENITKDDIIISAIPMYNLPESSDSRHTKGRGNGYILDFDGTTVYISGDTEDIPEMRSLKGIDLAFVCMNLPYTMDINQAASAVLEFQPKVVYPYHYRGKNGFSDVNKFKELVNKTNPIIDVRLRAWYPQ